MMNAVVLESDPSKISGTAARLAIVTGAAVILLLASLHVLSPEFDPAWRLVSEYATGQYGWVLSLMFTCLALSSWALAFTIRSQVRTQAGRIGLAFLIIAGIGEAMAAVFDLNNPLHDVAGILGIVSLPVAAMLISVSLTHARAWLSAKQVLLWTANLTWIMLALFVAAMIVMIVGYTQAGNRLTSDVIAVVGYPNRLSVVLYCVWVLAVARQALKLRDNGASHGVGRASFTVVALP